MQLFEKPILVTRPYLPPLAEFQQGCAEIWKNQWLTKNGPVLLKFQKTLSDYLDVPETNLELFVNGTLALTGLLNLKVIDQLLAHSKAISDAYRDAFTSIPGLTFPEPHSRGWR